jgi:hypothetical protein
MSRKEVEYLPLRLLNGLGLNGTVYEDTYKKTFEISEDELVRKALNITHFLNTSDKEYVDFFSKALEWALPMLARMGYTPESIARINSENNYEANKIIRTEITDLLVLPILLDKWGRNKQVFKPDTSFCEAVLKTKDLSVTDEALNHLPCKDFYIDVSDCDMFKPIEGIFVSVSRYLGGMHISMVMLSGDLTTWTYYTGTRTSDGANNVINVDLKTLEEVCDGFNFSPVEKYREKSYNFKLSRAAMTIFTMQMILYLSSHEPQVEENQNTKRTYKKPSGTTVKNKFREVQMWDVGVKFGKSYRAKVKEYYERAEREYNTSKTNRKPPVPHFRSAHWQKYHVGKGRTETIVKWIEPTFVGGATAKNVTVHTV